MFETIKHLLQAYKKEATETTNIRPMNASIKKYIIDTSLECVLSSDKKYLVISCKQDSDKAEKKQHINLPADQQICKYMSYLNTMKTINPEVLQKSFVRTIYIVDLSADKQIYILPPIRSLKNKTIGSTTYNRRDNWFLYTNPNMQNVILECIKSYPKSR